MDILWSCLFTIIACTWTILHLNVPEQKPVRILHPQPAGTAPPPLPNRSFKLALHEFWVETLKWNLKGLLTNLKWMLISIIAPEVILGSAWNEWRGAKASCEEMQQFAQQDGVEWTVVHGFYANMGGFVAKLGDRPPPISFVQQQPDEPKTVDAPQSPPDPSRRHASTLTDSGMFPFDRHSSL
jgi:hypothetical protein